MRFEKRKLITLSLVIFWMTVIFLMSNQPAEESSHVSGSVSYRVVSTANTVLHWNLSEKELLVRAEAIQYPVRKCAHMTEYAILAILLFFHLDSYTTLKSRRRSWYLAWLVAVMYAATDEFHQIFIKGRSGRPIDVCIDATGALIGLFVFGLCFRIILKRRGDRNG
jgi:VanZ family protein